MSALRMTSLFVIAIAATVYLRLPFVMQNGVLNPDEGDLMVAGMRATESLVPYRTFTTSTYGPVIPQTLGALARLGYPLNLHSVRLLAAVIVATTAFLFWLILKRGAGAIYASLWAVPLWVMWIFGGRQNDFDFLHFSTSLLSVLFIALQASVFVCFQRGSTRHVILVGWFGTMAVLAKYQFAFVALYPMVLALSAFYRETAPRTKARFVITVLLVSLLPVLIEFFLIFQSQMFSRFWNEGIDVLFNYVEEGDREVFEQGKAVVFSLTREIWILFPLLAGVAFSQHPELLGRGWTATRLRALLMSPSWHLAIIGLATLMVSPRFFPHHLHLMLACGIAATGIRVGNRKLNPKDLLQVLELKHLNMATRLRFILLISLAFLLLSEPTLSRAANAHRNDDSTSLYEAFMGSSNQNTVQNRNYWVSDFVPSLRE
jgi:hypothetical protein